MQNIEILTLTETAQYLKVAEKTVQRLIKDCKIPCTRVGNQYRFLKSMLDEWLTEGMNTNHQEDMTHLIEQGEVDLSLSRLLHSVIYPMPSGNKTAILETLLSPLASSGHVAKPELYLEKLLMREEMTSTAIGDEVAIPHIRNPRENDAARPLIVLGLSPEGMEFDSIDGKKTHFFFLVHTSSEIVHLKILSRISCLFRSEASRQQLMEAAKIQKTEACLLDLENQYNSLKRSRIKLV